MLRWWEVWEGRGEEVHGLSRKDGGAVRGARKDGKRLRLRDGDEEGFRWLLEIVKVEKSKGMAGETTSVGKLEAQSLALEESEERDEDRIDMT